MATRVVEGKKPYTGGEAINIDENKVISLRLRDENNLIIYDSGDDEIYVDLQLPDGIEPTDAFPVGVTTGRVLVADDWDRTGTIICAKTTSGDNIKLLYADDGTLWIDNGTGTFKQIYFKSDVDSIIAAIQSQIDALSGLGKFLSLWDGETGEPISFPLSTPYTYTTGDWYMINVVDNTTNYRPDGSQFNGDASTTVETQATEIGDVYIYDGATWLLQKNGGGGGSAVLFSQVLGSPYDNTNLATALNAKQGTLTAGSNITIQNDTISATDTTYTAGTNIQISAQNVISATGGSDIEYKTQAEYNALLPGALTDNKHYFIYTSSTPPTPSDRPDIDTYSLAQTGSAYNGVHGTAVSRDGTYIYMCDTFSLIEYSMTNKDVTNLTQVNTKSSFNTRGMAITGDGKNIYSITDGNPYVRRLNMSTPFDISSGTLTTNTSGNSAFVGCATDETGTILVRGSTGTSCSVYYTAMTDGSISSLSWTQKTLTVVTVSGQTCDSVYDVKISPTGTKMFVNQHHDNDNYGCIAQYTLSTPRDISTATYDNKMLVLPDTIARCDFDVDGDGVLYMVLIGTGQWKLQKYTSSS